MEEEEEEEEEEGTSCLEALLNTTGGRARCCLFQVGNFDTKKLTKNGALKKPFIFAF